MARPQKDGLDYFPLDTDMDLKDDKIQLLEARYGIAGFGIAIKLLMKIYSEGYFYSWGEKESLLHSKRVNVDVNIVNNVVLDLVKWGLFNEKIFNTYKVLTSNGIQKRYWEVARRRSQISIIKQYWVFNVDSVLISANINLINVNNGTQRKEKKRIVKESKVYVAVQHLTLTEEEYNKLAFEYGSEKVDTKIEYAKNYKGLTKYVSLYLTLNNWLKKDTDKPKEESNNVFFDILREEGKM